MCNCVVNVSENKVKVKNSWRLKALFRIEKVLREVGQDSRAKRMGICGNTIFVRVLNSNILFQPQLRCKDRLCPVCNAYRSSILADKVDKLGRRMINPHMLTITAGVDNRDDLLVAFKNYKVAVRKLKRDTWFKRYVTGGIEHIEVKYNEDTGWHIHSHMLVDLNLDYKIENLEYRENGYIVNPIKKELEILLSQIGLGKISDIRPVTEGYGKEISKYCLKFGLDIQKERLKEIITVMKGKRMVSRFGNCFGVQDDLEDLTEEEEKEYENYGTLEEVVQKCFSHDVPDKKYIGIVLEAVRIGLLEIDFNEKPILLENST